MGQITELTPLCVLFPAGEGTMGGKGQEGNRRLSEDKHNAVATDRKDVHWRMNVRSIPLLVRVVQ